MSIERAVPIIVTEHPAATRAFFVEVLGFEVVMDHPGFVMLGSTRVASTQVIIAWDTPDAFDPNVMQANLSVDVGSVEAVQAAHDDAVRRGLEIVHPVTDEPWGIRRCFIREASGAVVNVAAHIKR